MKNRILWDSVVGSHMWGTNHEGSDIDINEIWLANFKDILVGKTFKGKFSKKATLQELDLEHLDLKGTHVEVTSIEIGHLIELLKKGNINALWMVLSPIWSSEFPHYLNQLRKITTDNLSVRTWYSIRGMAFTTVDLAVKKNDNEFRHRIKMANRTLNQFDELMTSKEMKFKFPENDSIGYTSKMINEIDGRVLRKDYKILDFPDESKFDDFLYKVRIEDIVDEVLELPP